MPFVSTSIYQKAIRLAREEGLPPALLAHHDSHPALAEGSKYMPISLLLEAYEQAGAHLAPGFGVRQGRQLDSDDYGTLGLSWKTCWRAREVLDRVERYMVLVTDHGNLRIDVRDGMTCLKLLRPPKRPGIATANEASFVMLTNVLEEVTGQAIKPVEVFFQHTTPDPHPFTDFFACPVHFGQKENAIHFKTADIDIPTIKADQSIHHFLLERMEEEKQGIHVNADHLLSEIHELVEEALPSGIPSIIQVAEHLGMSARTLKRRLADKQLTFRELVQTIQQDVATDLLRNTPHSMGEIAFQTGFSEQSAFNRAFKRWTGQAPADFRKNG
ncbi:MAG: AraC family transcriptional regulator ligand-binding domain-containing protein [Lewinella sp.]|nr:AraC family transcriptional regulator ligand-binding domain-containing protein [Lewinella sp.]